MCGIFGVVLGSGAALGHRRLVSTLSDLYCFSESRGKESAGLHGYFPTLGKAWTLKEAQRASLLLKSREFNDWVDGPLRQAFSAQGDSPSTPVAIVAHSRLVTNGTAARRENNQPVRSAEVTMIHNGIVVNVEQLWRANPHLSRRAQVDTEVMCALAADAVARGAGPIGATQNIYANIRGAASIAWLHERANWVSLATNTGDLYFRLNREAGWLLFASERYILEQTLHRLGGSPDPKQIHADWIAPGRGVLVNLLSLDASPFEISGGQPELDASFRGAWHDAVEQHDIGNDPGATAMPPFSAPANEKLLRYSEAAMRAIRRCTRCILPETFPFIRFDKAGVCSYCASYRPRYKGRDPEVVKRKFIDFLQRYRSADGSPDVIMAFSGGRDSSYGLHLVKKEFGLTPITFTYDWGMVTDLARRNIARLCGSLGVQNILVSADIKVKRENIRKNVAAWLRKPDLGMIPLFMAGDKHFFSVVNRLKRQTGIALDVWSANPLENTDFKSGFCGVPPDFAKHRVDYLSFGRKLKLASYYGSRFVSNPGYLNSSLFDTAGAFLAYYVEPRRDFFFLFDHLVWDEDIVNKVLIGTYDWEVAPDIKSTWRIGDGTAPFYNYIYVTARGFSEFDTFRSNQIREGMISREQALAGIVVENRPRADSLRWYLDTIGLDFDATIRRINELDRLSLHGA